MLLSTKAVVGVLSDNIPTTPLRSGMATRSDLFTGPTGRALQGQQNLWLLLPHKPSRGQQRHHRPRPTSKKSPRHLSRPSLMPHCTARNSVATQSRTSGGAGERRGDFSLVRCDWTDFVNLARFVRKQKRRTFFTSGISHRWNQRKDRSELLPRTGAWEDVQILSDSVGCNSRTCQGERR